MRLAPALPTVIAAACLLAGCAQQPSHEAAAAPWATTTRIEAPPVALAPAAVQPPPRAASQRPVVTASLTPAPRPEVPKLSGSHALDGIASFYWQDQKTANGERFDKMAMTGAHKTLPFGTRVKVTNRNNGRSVVVRINDRGPFKPGRVIDLSLAAADVIGMRDKGLVPVKIEVVN